MLNKVEVMGRLVADPELRYTTKGKAVVSFSLAVERDRPDSDGQRRADFFNVVTWDQTAEFVNKWFKKGQMICIVGSLQNRSYEKNGQKRTVTEIVASEAHFCGSKSSTPTIANTPYNNGDIASAMAYAAQPDPTTNTAPTQDTGFFDIPEINDDECPF